MNSLLRYAALPALLVFILAPFASAAAAGYPYYYDDGSTQSTTTRQQFIGGMRNQSPQIQQQINALGSASSTAVFMPVLFGVSVSDLTPNFGDPRDNGTRTHEGEDIMAVQGTPVVSPTAAVVLKTEVGASEGNAVYTANPGGEVFVYMHLEYFGEGVAEGAVLQQGSLIGYVGNTGDASGGPSHLHLEIHNANNVPTDPFPRLTAEFTPAQKISYLTTILGQTASSTALAQLLVTNFRATFVADVAANIALPQAITDALVSVPVAIVATSNSGVLPVGDLDLGSTGAAVVTLQQYLIQAAAGPASVRLAQAGATGTFGPLTKAALVEYQLAVGISPASGYYGPLTRAKVLARVVAVPQTPVATSTAVAITKDLHVGVTDVQVRTLQQLLNAHGFTVATSGAGSAGVETDYFGPATLAAVIAFQTAHSVSPAVGYVGPLTRAALAAL